MAKNPIPEDWSYQQIQVALIENNITIAAMARDLGVNYSTVYRVARNTLPSDRIRRHIARCINREAPEIWPSIYLTKKDPTRRGRPVSQGLQTGAEAAA